jgi:hypothetical protein
VDSVLFILGGSWGFAQFVGAAFARAETAEHGRDNMSAGMSNHRAALGAGRTRCFHVEHYRPGPSEHDRWADAHMTNRPLHPALRLGVSGVLSLLVLYLQGAASRGPREPGLLLSLAGAAAGAFMLLVPVMVRGDAWQKMVAGALLFVPSLGLVLTVCAVVSSL